MDGPPVARRAARAAGARTFRPDIQALRAIAVLLVVLYHAQVPGTGGGYVGVDVFFVISGFLITGQLIGDVVRHGRIRFVEFYVKRARRLLAPATLVAVATLFGAAAWLPPLRVRALTTDVIYTAFYGLNYRLAAQGIDYQNENAPPSALQHYWSLAVEEQFYVLWPALIMLVVLLARRRWARTLPVTIALLSVASLLLSQTLLHSDAPMAYFSLQSRAWELGVGALLALGRTALARLPGPVRELLVVAGVGGVLACGALYTNATAFPGVHALGPVLGSAAVIAGGCGGATAVERVLAVRVVQWIGKLSYPWYLWHWPLLILAPAALPQVRFRWPENLALMALGLGLAWITYRAVEIPIKRSSAHRPEWLAGAALLSATTVVLALVVGLRASITMGGLDTAAAAGAQSSSALFAAPSAVDPFVGPSDGPVTPSVIDAVGDTPSSPADCIVDIRVSVSPPCLINAAGHVSSAAPTADRVVLLGDSHAGQWYAPVQAIAASHGWSTEVLTKAACPAPTLTVDNSQLKRRYTECDAWRASTLARLAREPAPKIVFVASLNSYATGPALAAGWRTTLTQLRALGAPVVYLRDTPVPDRDEPTCLSQSLPRWTPCAFARVRALPADPLADSPATFGLTAVIDVDGYLCPGTGPTCPAARGGTLFYRDASHVTSTAMTDLTPVIRHQLLLAGLPH